MTKSEFLAELRRRISNLPPDEVERTISYFSEIIDDRMEDGMTELDAICSLESVENIAREVVPTDRETRLGRYSAAEVSSVRIKDLNCSVVLECSGSDMITLDYYENKYKKYDIRFSPGGELYIKGQYIQKWSSIFNLNMIRPFVLGLPRDFTGNITLETSNGSIKASSVNIAGDFSIISSNAAVDIKNMYVGGRADLRTSNGHIHMENLKALDLTANTMNGKIDALSVSSQNSVTFKTMNSPIHLDKLFSERSIFLITSNSGIRGTINDDLRTFNVRSRTMNGRSTLPSKMDGGTKDLTANTMNGNIDLYFLGQ